jgi:2-methylisocitrate lyase-like PEP mutase family enzyme
MAEIAKRIDKPLLANMVEGGRTPIVAADRLQEMGFAISIFPGSGFLATADALENVYTDIKQNGRTTEASKLYSFADFNTLIGFEDVWEFEKKYARE